MRLHRIKMVNFRQHAETELAFGPGITAIVGPNGAGKTTILEAIAWSFYGTPAARGNRNTLRRFGAPARAPVRAEVEFSLGPHDYRVVRHLYGAELYQDAGAGPIANTHQAVSTKIGHLLGMNHDEFFSTYFTGQKELTVMGSMGPTERAKFLSRLLGYEKLKHAQDRLRAARSVIRAEVSGMEQGLEDGERLEAERRDAAERLADAERRLREVAEERERAAAALTETEPRWDRLRELREQALATEAERKVAEQQVLEARREFERLDRDLTQAVAARNRLEEMADDLRRAEALQTEVERLDRDAQAVGRKRAVSGQLVELGQQLQRLEKQRGGLGEPAADADHARAALDGAHARLDEARSQEKRAHTAWVRDRQDAETKRLSLRDQYRDIQSHREQVVTAGPEGTCPTCARPLGAEYQVVLETLERQMEDVESNGRYYKSRMDQLTSEPEDLRSAQRAREEAERGVESTAQIVAEADARLRLRDETQRELTRLTERTEALNRELAALPGSYDASRHDAVRAELRALHPAVDSAVTLRIRAEHAERLVSEAEEADKVLSEREGRLRELTERLAHAGYREEDYRVARQEHEDAVTAVRRADVAAAEAEGDHKAAGATMRGVERRVEERAERLRQAVGLRRKLAVHDELDAALEDLRAELNATLRPDLSDLGSAFLAELTGGRYHEFELDEQYRISVLEDGVPKPVISGGEEDLTNLALRLAISQMVAERAGQPLSLLVLDEIFGSLDEGRRDLVVELLRKLADRFSQVVLITHIESVKDGVDQVIRVSVDTRERVARVKDEVLTDVFATT